jgi:hypothetical protein
MMRNFKLFSLSLALVWTWIVAAQAQAGMLTATLSSSDPLNPATPVNINLGDGTTAGMFVYTPGVVNWTIAPGGNQTGLNIPTNFTSFCIELTQDISPGNSYAYTVNTSDPNTGLASAPVSSTPGNGMGTAAANALAQLFGQYYNTMMANGTGVDAAAFQLAIWKIEYDWGIPGDTSISAGNTSFATGNFLANSSGVGSTNVNNANAAISLAENWLNSIAANPITDTPASVGLYALTNPNYQDQIIEVPPSSLPVPSTAYLAGFSILCLFGYRYVSRKTLGMKRIATLLPL